MRFLYRLQQDLLGPPDDQDAIDDEATRILLAGVPEPERDSAARNLTLDAGPVPTPYEWPQEYSILRELADDIVTAFAEDVILPHQPLVGTLPLGWPMALLLRVPHSSTHIVAVERTFTTFANLLAKACAQGLMPPPGIDTLDGWKAWLASGTHPGVNRYVELITATLQHSPSAAPPYWPDPEWSPIAVQLRTAIEVFVMSEPFVHLARLDREPSPVLPLVAVHPDAESYNWEEPQRAGAVALRVAITASVFDKYSYDKPLGYWGIHMFLITMVLIEWLQARRRGKPDPEGTFAQQELGWLRFVLEEAGDSQAIALQERLQPVRDAFTNAAAFACHGGGDSLQ